jgi:hypothetical protein
MQAELLFSLVVKSWLVPNKKLASFIIASRCDCIPHSQFASKQTLKVDSHLMVSHP